MMPICQHRRCRKPSTEQVGATLNSEDSISCGRNIYDPLYLCEKHVEEFKKLYGGEE